VEKPVMKPHTLVLLVLLVARVVTDISITVPEVMAEAIQILEGSLRQVHPDQPVLY
jgi:hypothetical protein